MMGSISLGMDGDGSDGDSGGIGVCDSSMGRMIGSGVIGSVSCTSHGPVTASDVAMVCIICLVWLFGAERWDYPSPHKMEPCTLIHMGNQ